MKNYNFILNNINKIKAVSIDPGLTNGLCVIFNDSSFITSEFYLPNDLNNIKNIIFHATYVIIEDLLPCVRYNIKYGSTDFKDTSLYDNYEKLVNIAKKFNKKIISLQPFEWQKILNIGKYYVKVNLADKFTKQKSKDVAFYLTGKRITSSHEADCILMFYYALQNFTDLNRLFE